MRAMQSAEIPSHQESSRAERVQGCYARMPPELPHHILAGLPGTALGMGGAPGPGRAASRALMSPYCPLEPCLPAPAQGRGSKGGHVAVLEVEVCQGDTTLLKW